ncbi:Mkk2p [Rhizophagus irregularis DAOM 197198w]|uniref:Mkk2p n=1 Tax=Rhizophagus irregularis (strain DAOM 197198w) TaxID=1432141 RepID=A0A015MBA4_RHIIW|nr:Mkk2p [Rhizophagus irregularis DAOM 197198w]
MSSQNTCKKCSEVYTDIQEKWCKQCITNYLKENFTNWTSKNEKLDNFIQEMQLNIDNSSDIIFEWIPYNQFNDIKEIIKDDLTLIYSAIWKDGPLYHDNKVNEYIRKSNKNIVLKCSTEFLDEVKTYSTNLDDDEALLIYGITQNPDTKEYFMVLQDDYCKSCNKRYTNKEWCYSCQTNKFKINFTNWTSGNKKIDDFIQGMQLSMNSGVDILFEWIPYDQFDNIKVIDKDDSATVYSAKWKDGPLRYNANKKEYVRNLNQTVDLKCVYDSQNIIDEFLNEVATYSTAWIISFHSDKISKIYGISQHPDTKDYIMVLKNKYCENCGKNVVSNNNEMNALCKPCQINHLKKNLASWFSGNEEIDDFIQEMQLKINYHNNLVFEWVPYTQFNDIKKISNIDDSITIYSAIWEDGPLCYKEYDEELLTRESNTMVILKCFNNSQNITGKFLNEVEIHLTNIQNYDDDYVVHTSILEMHRIAQRDTNYLDMFAQKRNKPNYLEIYGMSQNPDTKDYIMIFQDGYCKKCGEEYTDIKNRWCKPCRINYFKENFTNWTSQNKEIDSFIQEIQLSINHYKDKILEWIPYNQFIYIKEISKGNSITICKVIWKDGPLYYDNYEKKWSRNPYNKVALKFLYNSQNIIDEFLNEVKMYLENEKNDQYKITDHIGIYGISQNPDTKDYIMILQDVYCEECGEEYTDKFSEWCKSCQINYLKSNFSNWTSGNGKVDNLIQEIQLKIDTCYDMIFEWIPFNQFTDLKEIGKGGFSKVYSATWKDGPLCYDLDKKEWIRQTNEIVALKCLFNSQNINDKFLNEVKAYSTSGINIDILQIYGISQNPDTKNYILILRYAKKGDFNNWIIKNYENFDWNSRIEVLSGIVDALEEIHEKNMFHRDLHTGNILFRLHDEINVCISDMGLCGDAGNMDETKIIGVMPYVAPERLEGNPYTQASDIYSLGMIMYFIATGGRKPFDNCAHDENLALKICNGIRPEFNESEVPKCYIELMKRCWDSNPANRPSISEIKEVISLFEDSCSQQYEFQDESHYEIEKQFKEAEICRRLDYVQSTTHPQAIYKARELNSFTTGLSKNINNEVSDNDNNKVSDEMAVEDLFIQDVENNEFSDNIAVEELLLQHTMQNWQ